MSTVFQTKEVGLEKQQVQGHKSKWSQGTAKSIPDLASLVLHNTKFSKPASRHWPCHEYPVAASKAMFQFPSLIGDGGLQLPPSWGMSHRKEHELGLKRSWPELRCHAGLVSSWWECCRTLKALTTAKNPSAHPPRVPWHNSGGLPAGWAKQSGVQDSQPWSSPLCITQLSGAQATC